MTDQSKREKLRLLLIKYGQSCYKGFVDPSDLITAIEALGYVEPLSEEEIEGIFRKLYVPLYPDDKPISEMTSYEQGLYKQVLTIAHAIAQAQRVRGRK